MSTVTAELKFVSPQYFADVVKAKDAKIEGLRRALTNALGLIAANRLMLGEYSGVRHVGTIENDARTALAGSVPSESEGQNE